RRLALPRRRQRRSAVPGKVHLLRLGEAAMIESAVDCVAGLYVATNSLRVFFYAPQIRAVSQANDGARAVSLSTWGFWTFANLTAMLYGWFVIHDGAFTAIFAGNLACTAAVTLIAARKRWTPGRPSTAKILLPVPAPAPRLAYRLGAEDRPGC